MIKAILYTPGEAPYELPIDQQFTRPLALFPKKPNGEPNHNRAALADPARVAECLDIDVEDVQLLHSSSTMLVYGHRDAADIDGRPNPKAEQAVGVSLKLTGIVLIISAD